MGVSAEVAMRLLREAMEGFMVPDLVSRTIFDALGEYGGNLPEQGRELKTFVEGPLSRALVRRTDERTRAAIVQTLAPIVDSIIASEIPPPGPTAHEEVVVAPPPAVPEDMPTERRLTSSEPFVLVIAGGRAMEQRLRLALGGDLGTSTAHTIVDVQAAILARSPRVVLIDAVDPAPISERDLARALGRARPDSLSVVWGSTRPFARALLERTAELEPPPMGLEEAEGVEPLLDLVRSHGMESKEPAPRPGISARTFMRPKSERPPPSASGSRPTPAIGSLQPPRRKPKAQD